MVKEDPSPLIAVLIDPSNSDHVKELTRQRIKCGWSAEQVPEWMEECKTGKRKHFLYYEKSTGLPVGSSAITTLSHMGSMLVGGPLPPSTINCCSLYVDSDFRGKSYGNVIMDHRHEVAFSDPQVEKCILDTMARLQTLRTWHKRLGYVQIGEPVRSFERVEDLPDYMRRVTEDLDHWNIVFSELTREKWQEKKKENITKDAKPHGVGIPLQTIAPPTYSEEEQRQMLHWATQ